MEHKIIVDRRPTQADADDHGEILIQWADGTHDCQHWQNYDPGMMAGFMPLSKLNKTRPRFVAVDSDGNILDWSEADTEAEVEHICESKTGSWTAMAEAGYMVMRIDGTGKNRMAVDIDWTRSMEMRWRELSSHPWQDLTDTAACELKTLTMRRMLELRSDLEELTGLVDDAVQGHDCLTVSTTQLARRVLVATS